MFEKIKEILARAKEAVLKSAKYVFGGTAKGVSHVCGSISVVGYCASIFAGRVKAFVASVPFVLLGLAFIGVGFIGTGFDVIANKLSGIERTTGYMDFIAEVNEDESDKPAVVHIVPGGQLDKGEEVKEVASEEVKAKEDKKVGDDADLKEAEKAADNLKKNLQVKAKKPKAKARKAKKAKPAPKKKKGGKA